MATNTFSMSSKSWLQLAMVALIALLFAGKTAARQLTQPQNGALRSLLDTDDDDDEAPVVDEDDAEDPAEDAEEDGDVAEEPEDAEGDEEEDDEDVAEGPEDDAEEPEDDAEEPEEDAEVDAEGPEDDDDEDDDDDDEDEVLAPEMVEMEGPDMAPEMVEEIDGDDDEFDKMFAPEMAPVFGPEMAPGMGPMPGPLPGPLPAFGPVPDIGLTTPETRAVDIPVGVDGLPEAPLSDEGDEGVVASTPEGGIEGESSGAVSVGAACASIALAAVIALMV